MAQAQFQALTEPQADFRLNLKSIAWPDIFIINFISKTKPSPKVEVAGWPDTEEKLIKDLVKGLPKVNFFSRSDIPVKI